MGLIVNAGNSISITIPAGNYLDVASNGNYTVVLVSGFGVTAGTSYSGVNSTMYGYWNVDGVARITAIGEGCSVATMAAGNYSEIGRGSYTVGAFHFPGWSTPGGGPVPSNPWSVIPANRLPLVGAYNEALQSHCDYEMVLARDHGLAYMAYDWYSGITSGGHVPFIEHSINNHKKSQVKNKPKYCINFVTQYNTANITTAKFPTLYNYWIDNYLKDANYLTFDGKPVVFVFDGATFFGAMGSSTATVTAQLNNARAAAVAAGLPGIHFCVLEADSAIYWINVLTACGFDSISAYTVFSRYQNGSDNALTDASVAFSRLDQALYSADEVVSTITYHSWAGSSGYANPPTLTDTGTAWVNPTLPANSGWLGTSFSNCIMPIASGFDARPWTYADLYRATPSATDFEAHLVRARNMIDTYRSKTKGFGVITGWNEYGEGSFLMPTVAFGNSRLESFKRVFGANI